MKEVLDRSVRVRFAPSPTGHLHIGGLRTALFNYLFARHHGGQFLLRIEDTDRERSKKEYFDSILASLTWVQLQSDEPVLIQSEQIKRHQEVIQKLLASGKVYRCYCAQESGAQEHHEGELFFKYDGRCRSRSDQPDLPYVVRFKLPDFHDITFHDLIRGHITIPRDQLDDFIIVRSDGTPMYNFVVVVDDAAMQITHVIRGEDHISNTPKQILLYQACGFSIPQFAHIPLILGPSGDRLSKRDGAVSVLAYKELGYVPDAFVNYLVRLGWAHGDQEIFSREELMSLFTLDAVGKKGAIFDLNKLNWINGFYIRSYDAASLFSYITQDLDPSFALRFPAWDHEKLLQALVLYKDRVATLCELMEELTVLYQGPSTYNEQDMQVWVTKQVREYLQEVAQLLQIFSHFDTDAVSTCIKQFAKNHQLKLAQIAQPIRIALIGKSSGPGIFEMLVLLGKKESGDRIAALHNRI